MSYTYSMRLITSLRLNFFPVMNQPSYGKSAAVMGSNLHSCTSSHSSRMWITFRVEIEDCCITTLCWYGNRKLIHQLFFLNIDQVPSIHLCRCIRDNPPLTSHYILPGLHKWKYLYESVNIHSAAGIKVATFERPKPSQDLSGIFLPSITKTTRNFKSVLFTCASITAESEVASFFRSLQSCLKSSWPLAVQYNWPWLCTNGTKALCYAYRDIFMCHILYGQNIITHNLINNHCTSN